MAFEQARQELRFALRAASKTPGFTVAAVLTLALGIGVTTAMFSVVNTVFLHPLPYANAAQLQWVTERLGEMNSSVVLSPDFAAWQAHNKSFTKLEAYGVTVGANVSTPGRAAERIETAHVTPGFFQLLGARPAQGTGFTNNTAILSDRVWRRSFDADANVAGKPLVIDGKSYTVAGVMPAGFVAPTSIDTGIWLPDALKPGHETPGMQMTIVSAIGRLKPTVTAQQARADLSLILHRLDPLYSGAWARYRATTVPEVTDLQQATGGNSREALTVLMSAAALILLIVCANVAGLFLTRSVARQKDLAVRTALGATRLQLARLLLMESLLFGCAGGLLGLLLACAVAPVLRFELPGALPPRIALDWRVFMFAGACAAITTMLFGLLPMLAGSRADVQRTLKVGGSNATGSRGAMGFQRVLIVLQLALSLTLLVGASLVTRSLIAVLHVDAGFDAHSVTLANVSLAPVALYPPPKQAEVFAQILEKAQQIPGVELAAVASSTPLVPFNSVGAGLHAEGGPGLRIAVGFTSVSADYFRVLRTPLRAGRYFTAADREGSAPVVILNERLARELFGEIDPVGKRVGGVEEDGARWPVVVGVVKNISNRGLDREASPELFRPYRQAPQAWMSLVMRGALPQTSVQRSLAQIMASVDRSQPVFNVTSLEERIHATTAERRRRSLLLGSFALLATVIAAVGVYGAMAYQVKLREREFGIRMALGAQAPQVMRLVAREAATLWVAGIMLGLAGSLAASRLLATFLFGVTATDPANYASMCVLLAACVATAGIVPVRQASRADPLRAIRQE